MPQAADATLHSPALVGRVLCSPRRHTGLLASVIVTALVVVSVTAGHVEFRDRLRGSLPNVPPIDVHSRLFDLTPLTVSVTAGSEHVEWRTTVHELEPTRPSGAACIWPTGTRCLNHYGDKGWTICSRNIAMFWSIHPRGMR